MREHCYSCREWTEYVHIKEKTTRDIKGVVCTIDDSFYRCPCGNEMNDPEFDSLAAFYKEYERITG